LVLTRGCFFRREELEGDCLPENDEDLLRLEEESILLRDGGDLFRLEGDLKDD